MTAGSWSSAHLTDGVVRVQDLAALGGTPALAAELVAAGLWERRRNGWQFHDWNEKQPSSKEVKELRRKRAESGRKGGVASGKARSKREANASALASRSVEPPSRRDGEIQTNLPIPSGAAARANPPGSPARADSTPAAEVIAVPNGYRPATPEGVASAVALAREGIARKRVPP